MMSTNNAYYITFAIKHRSTTISWLNRCRHLIICNITLKTCSGTNKPICQLYFITHSLCQRISQYKNTFSNICHFAAYTVWDSSKTRELIISYS